MEERKKQILLEKLTEYNKTVNDINKFQLNKREENLFCTIMQQFADEYHSKQLRQYNVSGICFGRISESVFSDLKSLDDLIVKMGTTKDGYKISDVGEPDDFKSRMKYFKEFLKRELPEFTEEDILKFDKHFQKFRKIYEWRGAEYFLTAMEYEARNNYQ